MSARVAVGVGVGVGVGVIDDGIVAGEGLATADAVVALVDKMTAGDG
jgi:hypothetical protein